MTRSGGLRKCSLSIIRIVFGHIVPLTEEQVRTKPDTELKNLSQSAYALPQEPTKIKKQSFPSGSKRILVPIKFSNIYRYRLVLLSRRRDLLQCVSLG